MHGSFGRYLHVDLTTRTISGYLIPEEWERLYIGGRGIAARILLEELSGKDDPLSPDNIVVFGTGPFQGTGVLGAGRHIVMGLSPKTGSVAGSYVGGYFGHELGRSGYDGIILRGAATEPVYLTLLDGSAEIHSSPDLWGKGVLDTTTSLTESYPRSRVAAIGIAGENLVQMSCIMHDVSRSAGRPGLGAVMGSKMLKAIVVRGNQEKPLYDKDRFLHERGEHTRDTYDEDMRRLGEYGTAGGVTWLSDMGILPTKNFQEGTFDQAKEIGGERMHDTILTDRAGCAGCPIRCKRAVKTTFAGREVDPRFGGPEYETTAAFGSLCLNDDLSAIALASQLCNDYGLDTISAGVAAAFMMEASEKGLVDEDIQWGDGEAIIRLIDQIAHREGIGDRIADGLEEYAAAIGADFAMTIKGVEIPMHEPRGKQGLGISYATSPRGATHMEGMHDTMLTGGVIAPELGFDHPYDRFTLADKAGVAKTYEDVRSFVNSLILCAFTVRATGEKYNLPRIRALLEAETGLEVSAEEMLLIGERNYALLRLHTARAGYTMEDDGLPTRFSQPLPGGASADHPIDAKVMEQTIKDYYEVRGYDRYGPTDDTLRHLGMDDLIGVIDRRK
ncbi:MAG: aldehyde ferredoxin oxidoreductase family protein [Candidatus Bipolaricaulota bacterium]|nr:aldehyde ferredoxin oxidoreductase family protein [Candidatus Bipolaricaulota bacterium]